MPREYDENLSGVAQIEHRPILMSILRTREGTFGLPVRLTGEVRHIESFSHSLNMTASFSAVGPEEDPRTLPTTAGTLSVVSASADDNTAGTGARLLLIDGIDGRGFLRTAVLPMTGTTPSTSASWLSVNRASVLTSGSGRRNADQIDLSIGGNLQSIIQGPIGQTNEAGGSTKNSYSTMPLDYIGVLHRFRFFWSLSQTLEIECTSSAGLPFGHSPQGRIVPASTTTEGTEWARIRLQIDSGTSGADIMSAVPILPGETTWCRARRAQGQGDLLTLSYSIAMYRIAPR